MHQEALKQGIEKPTLSEKIMQQKKQPVKQSPPRRLKVAGAIKLPSRRALQACYDLEQVDVQTRYVEYRDGLMRAITNGLANVSHDDPDKKHSFVEGLCTSKDLFRLIIDTSLIRRLDEMGGIPKIALTVVGKYGESL